MAQRPSPQFLLAHPAHTLALGMGSGLSPRAPGTVGTLWAWLCWWALSPWLSDWGQALLIVAALFLGWWACTITATHLGMSDPSAIVWDEVVAFWTVLWVLGPVSLSMQLAAFFLFRFFDAVKPPPVSWADQVFKGSGWRGGWGIVFDDLVAGFCTLLCLAIWVRL